MVKFPKRNASGCPDPTAHDALLPIAQADAALEARTTRLIKTGGVNWTRLLGENGWRWDSQKSIQEEYSFYEARIFGCQYDVRCWARVSDTPDGNSASGDWGVAWIECDISTYTSREFIGLCDAQEIMYAIDHAETNLLRCGVPFVEDYRFAGKNASNKARRNAAIRMKLGLKTKEEMLHGCEDEN